MKSKSLIAVGLTFLIAGCAGVEVKPSAKNIKTVAIVSLYMNSDVYNIDQPTAEEGTFNLRSMVKGFLKEKTGIGATDAKAEKAERNKILTYALKCYWENLNGLHGWAIVPADAVLNEKHYAKWTHTGYEGTVLGDALAYVQKTYENKYDVVPGMRMIPIEELLNRGSSVEYVDGKKVDRKKEILDSLAGLATDMNVDAVAIVQMDMGYRFGKLAKHTEGDITYAKPSVSSAMVIVTRDGEIAVRSQPVERGKGTRYEGGGAALLKNDQFTLLASTFLQSKKGQGVEGYNEADKKAAAGLRAEMEKKLEKI